MMKRILEILMVMLLVISFGCSKKTSAEKTEELSGSYTYTFTGMVGKETMQFDFADGKVTMSLPGNQMITDTYESEYTVNADGSVAITGFINTDSSSSYKIPGLWSWIDSGSGACTVTIDQVTKTFTPKGEETADEKETQDKTISDLSYASNSASQTLDLILPEGEGPFPLVILLHGGGFKFGDKQMPLVQKMFTLTKEGYAVASVNYRLSGEAIFPAAVSDAKAAVRYLRANAGKYNLDSERFAIWGESAGAYLACMTAFTDDQTLSGDVKDNPDTSSAVKVLIDFYGPVSFYLMDQDAAALGNSSSSGQSGSFESDFIGKAINDLSDEEKKEIDPLTYISSERPLGVWIQAGDADTNVPYTQSERLAEACNQVYGSDSVYFAILKGAVHEDDAFYTEDNLKALEAFLKKNL